MTTLAAIEADASVLGKVVWREKEGRVEVEAAPAALRLWARPETRLLINGDDFAARLRPVAKGTRELPP